MADRSLVLWESRSPAIVPNSANSPAEIAGCARQLRDRDIAQIVSALEAHHFEMASTFVWTRAMAALRKQLATLGSDFIGEMLQRPDIGSDSDISIAITDSETISLAEDLGMVSATGAMRLRHAHEAIAHFSSLEQTEEDSDDARMTPEEAIGCLRSCVQSVLGHPKLEVAHNFAKFRRELEERSFSEDDEKFLSLVNAPYFYCKTTLSVLMALLKMSEGAQLQHAVNNARVAVSLFWQGLRKPERWQIGQTYAELYSAGKKTALVGLRTALLDVSGFDYVPENLRSNTFTRAAAEVLKAHEGMNNFYTEAAPMKVLASLGTTIPPPALSACMTAVLSVWLGNSYGHAWTAAPAAEKLLDALTADQWLYYMDGCLPGDRRVLYKLTIEKPVLRWRELVTKSGIGAAVDDIKTPLIRRLLEASKTGDSTRISKIATTLYQRSSGSD